MKKKKREKPKMRKKSAKTEQFEKSQANKKKDFGTGKN